MVTKEKATQLAKRVLRSNFSAIDKGMNNWVFERGDRILTIPRHERVKGYGIRVAATRKLESAGIPIASIIEYAPGQNGISEYLIVEKIDGENVDLSQKTASQRESIHQSAGETLKAIHSISGEGFGRFDKYLIGQHSSWIDFVDSFFEDSFQRLERDNLLLAEYGSLLRTEYKRSRDEALEVRTGSFLHADYHLGNLLIRNKRVVAVLDLDIVTSGDPPWDIGHYYHTFNVDREEGMEAFRRGYGTNRNQTNERLYSLAIWTRKIGSQVIDRPEALKESLPELKKILEEE